MTTHVRRQIREAAKTVVTGLATTGSRVTTGDPYAKTADDGAFLAVAAPEDTRNPDLDGGNVRGRQLSLVVLGFAEAIAIEDVLDAIGLEVESALEGQTFGGLVKDINFVRATKTMDDVGKKRSGEIRIEFAVDYRIARGAPGLAVA